MDTRGIILEGEEITSGPVVPVLNKYSNDIFCRVATATTEHIEQAVHTAVTAREPLRKMSSWQRSEILSRAAGILKKRTRSFTQLIITEAGKSHKFALAEVKRAVENLQICAEEAKRIHGETVPVDASPGGAGKRGYFLRYPVGVVLAISPFNFPLNLAVHKIGPAIAAGCPVIFKPSTLTPVTGIELSRLLLEAGLPASALQTMIGSGPGVGDPLVRRKEIAKISFTGSRAVGEQIIRRGGLKKVTMELGSNSGMVVDEEVPDFQRAVRRGVVGAFAYQGQVCISVQRIYVHQAVFSSFQKQFVGQTEKLKVGDPFLRGTDIGPMISSREAERVKGWIDEAVKEGARILTGGERHNHFLLPTVLTDVSEEMRVMKEEVFGPVVSLVRVKDWEEGIRRCDGGEYGLQAGVFTRDLLRAQQAVDRINAGGIIINDIPTFRVDQMPYGGNKGSGLGREGARFAIEEMSNIRMVVVDLGEEKK